MNTDFSFKRSSFSYHQQHSGSQLSVVQVAGFQCALLTFSGTRHACIIQTYMLANTQVQKTVSKSFQKSCQKKSILFVWVIFKRRQLMILFKGKKWCHSLENDSSEDIFTVQKGIHNLKDSWATSLPLFLEVTGPEKISSLYNRY